MQVQIRQNFSLKRENRDKVPHTIKKFFVIDTCWIREKFSPRKCNWVYQPHSRAGPVPRSIRQHQVYSKFISMLVVLLCFAIFFICAPLLLLLCLICLFVSFFLLIIKLCFLFSFWERKEHKVEWVERTRKKLAEGERVWSTILYEKNWIKSLAKPKMNRISRSS